MHAPRSLQALGLPDDYMFADTCHGVYRTDARSQAAYGPGQGTEGCAHSSAALPSVLPVMTTLPRAGSPSSTTLTRQRGSMCVTVVRVLLGWLALALTGRHAAAFV